MRFSTQMIRFPELGEKLKERRTWGRRGICNDKRGGRQCRAARNEGNKGSVVMHVCFQRFYFESGLTSSTIHQCSSSTTFSVFRLAALSDGLRRYADSSNAPAAILKHDSDCVQLRDDNHIFDINAEQYLASAARQLSLLATRRCLKQHLFSSNNKETCLPCSSTQISAFGTKKAVHEHQTS